MSNKKSGRIAVPFLVTIFIGLIIIGGAALFIYSYFELGADEKPSEPIARNVATATYEDSHTVLLILDLPEQRCSSTFVVMRSVPKEKKLLFVGLPSNTIALVDGKQTSLKESYERGGASTAVSFSEQILDVEIDRYMVFGEEAFLKACDVLGGVSYAVKEDIIGFQDTDGEQYLNGQQIMTYITYPMFEKGEEQRAYTTSALLSSMVNQSDGKRLADGLDRTFNSIINLVESNITAVDYKNRKAGIKYMLERGNSFARFRIVTGKTASGDFIPDNTFRESMKEEYFEEPAELEEAED